MNALISSPELDRGENAGPVNCKPCLEKQPHSQSCRPLPMDATLKSSTVSTSLTSQHPHSSSTQQIPCPFASKMATQFFCFPSGPSLLQTRGPSPPHQEDLDFLRPRKRGPTLGSPRDDSGRAPVRSPPFSLGVLKIQPQAGLGSTPDFSFHYFTKMQSKQLRESI